MAHCRFATKPHCFFPLSSYTSSFLSWVLHCLPSRHKLMTWEIKHLCCDCTCSTCLFPQCSVTACWPERFLHFLYCNCYCTSKVYIHINIVLWLYLAYLLWSWHSANNFYSFLFLFLLLNKVQNHSGVFFNIVLFPHYADTEMIATWFRVCITQKQGSLQQNTSTVTTNASTQTLCNLYLFPEYWLFITWKL